MAKVTGIPTSITLDDGGGSAQVITNDVTEVTLSSPRGVQNVTGLDKLAMERLLLIADGTGTLKGVFNTAGNMSHAVLKTVPTTSQVRTLAIGYPGATWTGEVYVTDYQVTRAADGTLVWSAPFVLTTGTAGVWS